MGVGSCERSFSEQPKKLLSFWISFLRTGEVAELLCFIVPGGIALEAPLMNPGLPKQPHQPNAVLRTTVGSGLNRTYLDIQSAAPAVGYPLRPTPGSIADLDIIMGHCDFDKRKVCGFSWFV